MTELFPLVYRLSLLWVRTGHSPSCARRLFRLIEDKFHLDKLYVIFVAIRCDEHKTIAGHSSSIANSGSGSLVLLSFGHGIA